MVLVIKNLLATAGDLRDLGSVPGLGRSLGGWHSNIPQCSCQENPIDRGAWGATVHRVTESDMTQRLNNNKLIDNAILLVSDFLSTGPSITKNGVLKSPAATSPYSYFLMCSHAP